MDQKSSAQGGIGGERFWAPRIEKFWGVSPFLLKKNHFSPWEGGTPGFEVRKNEIWGPRGEVRPGGSKWGSEGPSGGPSWPRGRTVLGP